MKNAIRAFLIPVLFAGCVAFAQNAPIRLFYLNEEESPSGALPKAESPLPDKEDAGTNDDEDLEEKLPSIEAKTFPVRIVRRSNSNKIYLVEDPEDRKPEIGRILLLKKDIEPYMAFRVVKQYNDKKFLALKRIRKYGQHRYLDDAETFTAVEKIGDLHPPPLSKEDKNDLSEIEGDDSGLKARPFDPEVDTGTSPPPKDEPPPEEETVDAYTLEEAQLLDKHTHWLTFGFGYIRNGAPAALGGSFYFSSANIRYGLTLGKLLLVKEPRIQDSVAAEVGIHFYKSLGFVSLTDSYTVSSISLALRYNLYTSRTFGLFGYLGLDKGLVLSSNNGDAEALTTLGSLLPAVGAGLFFEIGPSWFLRFDIGLDQINANLVLRF